MIIPKNRSTSFVLLCLLLFSCKEKTRVDLAKVTFTEKAEKVINYDDKYFGGVNTIDGPLAFALQATKSSSFAFNGLKIDSANITFLLRSDKIKKILVFTRKALRQIRRQLHIMLFYKNY